MAFHAPEAFGEGLCIAMLAAWADFGAAAKRVPVASVHSIFEFALMAGSLLAAVFHSTNDPNEVKKLRSLSAY
jgi:drug/metabolite transporter (DMT)-like permease